MKYVIRIKLHLDEENDFVADILLTRKQTKEIKAEPDKYQYLAKNSTFDFLPQGSKETYPLKFRIIRIKIFVDNYETFVTNL